MKVKIVFNKKSLKLKDFNEVKAGGAFFGLMFYRREKAPILLFNMKSSLHSFFVFFNFLVLWLDEKNKIVDWEVVKPFTFYINSKKNYSKIVEIPISRRYNSLVTFIVGERFKKN